MSDGSCLDLFPTRKLFCVTSGCLLIVSLVLWDIASPSGSFLRAARSNGLDLHQRDLYSTVAESPNASGASTSQKSPEAAVTTSIDLYSTIGESPKALGVSTSPKPPKAAVTTSVDAQVTSSVKQQGSYIVCIMDLDPPFSLFRAGGGGTVRAAVFGTGLFQYHEADAAKAAGITCDLNFHLYLPMLNQEPEPLKPGHVWMLSSERCARPKSYIKQMDFIQYHDAHDQALYHKAIMPLGTSTAFAFAEDILPLTRRPYWFNLVVSLSTDPVRQEALRAAISWRVDKAKCGFIYATRKYDREYWKRASKQHVVRDECPHAGATAEDGIATEHLSVVKYREVIRTSVFTLSPPGHNLQCYRMWEAAESGSIPVIIMERGNKAFKGTCTDTLKFIEDAPFVFAKDVASAFQAMLELSRDESALSSRLQEVRRWYEEFMKNTFRTAEAVFLRKIAESKYAVGLPEKNARVAPRGKTHKGAMLRAPLVTGAGLFVSGDLVAWFSDVGIPAMFEGAKEGHVSVSWLYAAAASSDRLGSIPSSRDNREPGLELRFTKVVHLVREPLAHIRTLHRWDNLSFSFAQQWYPAVAANATRFEVAAQYWHHWNLLCGRIAHVRFRIEDLTGHDLLNALGKHSSERLDSLQEHVVLKKTGSPLSWSLLASRARVTLVNAIFEQALGYGYKYREHPPFGQKSSI